MRPGTKTVNRGAHAGGWARDPSGREVGEWMDEPLWPPRDRAAKGSADLVGMSPAMARLRADVALIGRSDAAVLVTGETGSGKENVARAIHAASARAQGPLEAVNCAAIPAELAEAELFGAEAGAYTGATRARMGRVEAAAGGTLFLDEIGDMPTAIQAKLLRMLETRSVTRLGGGRPIDVDVRIIAATHCDLERLVAEGRFRADLYWRLAVVLIDVPPLAERLEDLPLLIDHFARRHRLRLHVTACGLSALARHRWPGNLRELRNLVDRAVALQQRCLDAEAVARLMQPRRRPMDAWLAGGPLAAGRPPAAPLSPDAMGPVPGALRDLVRQAEAALIAQALAQCGGAVAPSARLLGMKRTTLIDKMRRMGLSPPANEAA